MLRRALPSLFCAFALVAPAFGQDVFVPRELKAVAAHPSKTKEVLKRAEPAKDAETKSPAKDETAKADTSKAKAPKTDSAAAKTEKAVVKEKSAPAKEQKAPLIAEQTTSKKVTETPKEKEKASKEKTAKADDVATIKVEKAVASKESNSKEKPNVAVTKDKEKTEKADSEIPTIKVEKATTAKKEPVAAKTVAKTDAPKADAKSEKTAAKEEPAHKSVAKSDAVKVETVTAKTEKAAGKDKDKAAIVTVKDKEKDQAATVAVSKSLKEKSPAKEESPKSEVKVAKTEKQAPTKEKEKTATTAPKSSAKSEPLVAKVEPAPPREGPTNAAKMLPSKADQVSIPTQKDPPQIIPAVSGSLDTGFTKIADGFDFPVGKPEAEGYYKARGFRPGGHLGEDWDGVRGGDTDLKDPIYSVGDGIVVFARDVHLGWGNVIIVRHAYRENGNVKYIDALYGHLNTMLVSRGQRVARGQQIATMGTAHGQYDAHLHFEIRKNLEIGMSRSKFSKDFSNYFDPTQFINSHRHLSGSGANYKVAMNTFTHDWMYHFDKNRDFASRKRSTSQSSAALRAALTSR
jgi:murein DD-endopeptidase MepM/ murein hydrolase activator NlpD